MTLKHWLSFALVIVAPLAGPSLAAQTRAPVTAPGLWPERTLAPSQKEFRDAVIVLRDSLRAVLATAARLDRAQAAGSNAVVASNARSLVSECERASRGAAHLQEQIKGFTTSEQRGNDALDRFRRALLALQHDMAACGTEVNAAVLPTVTGDKLGAAHAKATKAISAYDVAVQAIMKTLSIPLDPKNHKSAIET